MPTWRFAGVTALAAIALSLFFYCPRFENWTRGYPYSWETFRGASFLMQVEQPLRTDVEAAVRWRLLLPAICRALHLGRAALVVPWLGVLALLAIIAWRLEQLGLPRRGSVLTTFLVATTSATIIGLHWLGTNDAWVWAALCAVALGASRHAVIVCCSLAPWIDERFIIGLPLAATARAVLLSFPAALAPSRLVRKVVGILAWTVPYFIARVLFSMFANRDTGCGFLGWTWAHLHEWIAHAPFGWWEGLRAGWVVVLLMPLVTIRNYRWPTIALIAGVLAGTIVLMMLLAADLSRSAAILVPALAVGAVLLYRHRPAWTERIVGGCLLLNLVLPAATVISGMVLWHETFPRHFRWF